MLPNVVLPALLEVEDGAWTFTITVTITGEDEEDDIFRSESTCSRDELLKVGGCVSQWSKNRRLLPRSRYRFSSSNLASKRENGWEGSLLGPAEGNISGPTMPKTLFKAQPVRAQIGTKNCGLPAGLVVIQAHETVALSSSTFQRARSSAKVVPLFAHSQGLIEVRAGRDEAFSEEDGRAFERKAQSLPNPSPPSAAIVGCNLKGRRGWAKE